MATFRLSGLVFQWISIGLCGLASFGISIYIANALGAHSYGIFMLLLSLGTVISHFFDGGYKTLIYRECGTGDAQVRDIYLNFGIQVTGLLCLSAICLSFFDVFEIRSSHVLSMLFCFLALTLLQIRSGEMKGRGLLKEEAKLQLKVRLSSAASMAALLIFTKDMSAIFMLWGTVTVAILIFSSMKSGQQISHMTGIRFSPRLVILAAPFFLFDLMIGLYSRVEMIILAHLNVASDQIGTYGLAVRMLDAQHSFFAPVAILYFNYLSRGDALHPIINIRGLSFSSVCFLIAIIPFLMSWYLVPVVIPALVGDDFAAFKKIYSHVSLVLLFSLGNMLMFQRLLFLRLERAIVVVTSGAFVCTLLLNYSLIPSLGVTGAAFSRVCVEALVFLGFTFVMLTRDRDDVQTSS
jgi:O-antigen/teichoic acid export membrane protein